MKKNKNTLVIKIVENEIILELTPASAKEKAKENTKKGKKEGEIVVQSIQWQDEGNTSGELLKKIDAFLKKNNLIIQDLAEVKTGIDKKQKYTLARIIKIVAETINYCLK